MLRRQAIGGRNEQKTKRKFWRLKQQQQQQQPFYFAKLN